jgi:hypothetical protein
MAEIICPACGYVGPDDEQYNDDDGYYGDIRRVASQSYTSNTIGVDLYKCTNCGHEFAIVQCPNCSTKQVETPMFDTFTGDYTWDSECLGCGEEFEVDIPKSKVDFDAINDINANTNAGSRVKQTIAPQPFGAVSQLTQPVQVSSMQTITQQQNVMTPGGGLVTQQQYNPVKKKGGITGMNPIHVQNCLITIQEQAFRDECNQCFGGSQNYTIQAMKTKSGKDTLVLEPKTGGKLITFIDPITKDVTIQPYKFATRSWLEPTTQLFDLLVELARRTNGLFEGYHEDKGPIIIVQGQTQQAEFYIVKRGTVPNFDDNVSDDVATSEFRIIKPLKEFLMENPDIQAQISRLQFPDNLNTLGKLLIQMRQGDKIPFDIFKNLLIQTVIIGANDPIVKNMYDFVK